MELWHYNDRCANGGVMPERFDIVVAQGNTARSIIRQNAILFDTAAVYADLSTQGRVPWWAHAVLVCAANGSKLRKGDGALIKGGKPVGGRGVIEPQKKRILRLCVACAHSITAFGCFAVSLAFFMSFWRMAKPNVAGQNIFGSAQKEKAALLFKYVNHIHNTPYVKK